MIDIAIDRATLTGSVDVVEMDGVPLDRSAAAEALALRPPHPHLAPNVALPDDTRLWAALQRASGGTWAGCVFDVERIVAALDAPGAMASVATPAKTAQ
jgi:hypothetical protein